MDTPRNPHMQNLPAPTYTQGSLVRTESYAGVTAVILSRADKRNALTPDMMDELIATVRTALENSRALVLGGDGTVFCGGFDLKLCHQQPGTLVKLLSSLLVLIRQLRATDKPVIIAAHGAAIAGGCALLGAADVALTNREAALGYPVVSLGISPAVSAPFLVQRVGIGAGRQRLLDPGLIDGIEAARIGLVDICCDIREDVLPRAMRIAREMATKPPIAMAATKQLLREIEDLDGVTRDTEALRVSLSLAEGEEQKSRLAALWAR